jgi:hypothetical protein
MGLEGEEGSIMYKRIQVGPPRWHSSWVTDIYRFRPLSITKRCELESISMVSIANNTSKNSPTYLNKGISDVHPFNSFDNLPAV